MFSDDKAKTKEKHSALQFKSCMNISCDCVYVRESGFQLQLDVNMKKHHLSETESLPSYMCLLLSSLHPNNRKPNYSFCFCIRDIIDTSL